MNIAWQLLRPFNYLRIGSKAKLLVDVGLPICFALPLTILRSISHAHLPMLGPDGIATAVGAALPNLVGFYIAALAAVFGFNSVSLDQRVQTPSMKLPGEELPIVRRQLLCYMFGYLSSIGFMLLFVGFFAKPLARLFAILPAAPLAQAAATFLYFWALFSLFFTTFLGLYYLVDRAHSADPQLVPTTVTPIARKRIRHR